MQSRRQTTGKCANQPVIRWRIRRLSSWTQKSPARHCCSAVGVPGDHQNRITHLIQPGVHPDLHIQVRTVRVLDAVDTRLLQLKRRSPQAVMGPHDLRQHVELISTGHHQIRIKEVFRSVCSLIELYDACQRWWWLLLRKINSGYLKS
jgi:hypothetical protein